MLTPEQQQDLDRHWRYVEAQQLVSVMSAAKWRRLWDAVGQLPLRYRRKDVRGPEPSPDEWDRDVAHISGGAVFMEWLEIATLLPGQRGQLRLASNEEVERALLVARVPFSRESGCVRVWGYIRPGTAPIWVNAKLRD